MDRSSFINGPSMLQELTEKDITEEHTQEDMSSMVTNVVPHLNFLER